MANKDFYFKKNPPSKPVTVRSTVVIRLPLFNYGYQSIEANGYPSFQQVFTNYDAKDFARLLAGGPLNKAIKNALLYGYFGFPVANIAATKGDNNYKKGSTQFTTQNNYNLKYVDFLLNAGETDFNVLQFSQPGQTQQPSILSTKEFYQFGFLKPLPDFQNFQDPENFLLYEDGASNESYSIEDLDEISGFDSNFYKDIFLCLHGSDGGDYSSANVGGFNSFVEPIGVSARGSLFNAANNGSGLELINFNLFYNPPNTEPLKAGLLADTIGNKDFLKSISSWNSPFNAVDKTYARAWMPTAPPPNYQLWLDYTNPNSLTSFNPNPDLLVFDEETGESIPQSTSIKFTQQLNASNEVDEEPIDASWQKPINSVQGGEHIDSLALFMKPFQTSDWYQTFVGYGTKVTDQYKYVEQFQKYNLASMYKLVPSNLSGEQSSEYLKNSEFFLEDPARTLNSIVPRIFKYVSDIAPTAPLPSPLHGQSAGNVTVVNPDTVENGIPKLSDVLRKFRISEDDYTTKKYYNTPNRTSLGFNYNIGDYGESGKELIESFGQDSGLDPQMLEAKNKFVLVTKTESQREYLLDDTTAIGDVNYGFKQLDASFVKKVFPSPFQTDNAATLRESLIEGKAANGYPGGGPLNELEKTYKFSDYLLASLYFTLPPYYTKCAKTAALDQELKHKPDKIGIKTKLDHLHATGKKEDLVQSILDMQSKKTGGAAGVGQIPFVNFLINTSGNPSTEFLKNASVEQGQIWHQETKSGQKVPVAFIHINVEEDSPFTFPVWNYNYEDLFKIDFKSLGDFPESYNPSLSNLISTNPSVQYLKDYGVPEWVRGLRIYPTLDTDTTITRLTKSSLSSDLNTDYVVSAEDLNDALDTGEINSENNSYMTCYKNYSSNSNYDDHIVKKMVPAATFVMEPKIKNGNPNYFSDEIVSEFKFLKGDGDFDIYENSSYVEIRYAVEIDIDEKDLLLDMLGQGVFSLAGNISDYEKLGFDIEKLLFKSNGNLASQSLIEAYDDAGFTFDGVYGFDFGSFDGLTGLKPEACPLYPPDKVTQKVNEIFSSNAETHAVTSYVCLDGTDFVTVELKESPGKDSSNIGYLKSNVVVKVLKEWVNGKGEFNKIRVVDQSSNLFGAEGFIDPKVLRPVFPNEAVQTKIFFDQIFQNKNLSLAPATVTSMGQFAEDLKPDWWQDEKMRYGQPYEYVQEGEYWYTVELSNHECIPTGDSLDSLIYEAKTKGLKELLSFYGKEYTNEDVAKLIQTYLAARIDIDFDSVGDTDPSKIGFHVSDKPGDPILFLLKVGAIYINAFPDKQDNLEALKKQSTKIISLNTRWYSAHIQQAAFALNAIYYDILASDFRVNNFNFKRETERLTFVAPYLNRILAVNGYDLDSQQDNIINIGFDGDYKVVFFSYKEKDEPEKLLRIGFEHFASQEPFAFKNTMALLYRHRQIKDPTLKSDWQKLFTQWLPNPKPQIVPKSEAQGFPTDSRCTPNLTWQPPPLSQIWQQVGARLDEILGLDPRYDLGAFRFNLLQFFPPCPKPPAGRGLTVMRLLSEIEGETRVFDDLEILDAVGAEVDRIGQYVGDFMSSAQALEEIKLKIFTLDDLYEFLLNYISPELLYSKICKCFIDLLDVEDIGVPNLEINATGGSGGLNLKPSQIGKDPKELYDVQGPEGSINTEKAILSAEDLFCSFCFRTPSVFLRLPSTDLLAELINAFKKLVEFALAQILLQLIASLLETLLTCPDLECAPGASKVKDYGNQDISNIFNNSVPEGRFSDFVSECGLLIDGETITEQQVITMLQEVSSKLTTSEVLGVLTGTPSKTTLKTIQRVVAHYPEINSVMTNIGIIEDFFACAGDKLDQGVLNTLEEDNIGNISDPAICVNFNDLSKENILDKCGDLPEHIINAIKNRNLNHNFEKYKKIASFIRDNDDLSSQMPSLFEDGKGNQALLSSLRTETVDHLIDQTIDNLCVPIATTLTMESQNLTKPSARVLIKENRRLGPMYRKDIEDFVILAIGKKDGSDDLSGLITQTEDDNGEFKEEATQISDILQNINNSLFYNKEDYTITLAAQGGQTALAQLKLNPPKKDSQTQDLVYEGNHTTYVRSEIPSFETPIEYTIHGKKEQIPQDVYQYIQNFELEDTNVPEQAQVFANVILQEMNKLVQASGASDPQISQSLVELKNLLEGELYLNSVGTILDSIADTVSNGNIMKEYKITRYEEIVKDVFTLAAMTAALYPFTSPALSAVGISTVTFPVGVALSAALTAGTYSSLVSQVYPSYTKKQLQNLTLAPSFSYTSGEGTKSEGMIDLELVRKIVKENYNFAKSTDERSEALQMGQKAILNGMVSAFCQLFAGEAYAKSVYTLAHYPRELFDENLNGGILSKFVSEIMFRYLARWKTLSPSLDPESILEWENWKNFEVAWQAMVSRIIAEKPEFTNSNANGALPGLPGESTANGDNVTGVGIVSGKVFDTVTGREENIQDWKDATNYFVRQNTAAPLKFVKKRLNTVNYAKGLGRDQETNPFDSLVYEKLLQVHDAIVSDYELSVTLEGVADLPIEDQADLILDLPEVQEQDFQNYLSSKTESSLFSAGTDQLVTNEFSNGKFFYQFYFRIEDWESEQEASENDGIYVENVVNRKLKGEAQGNDNLKQVISAEALGNIIENMYPAGENYDLTDFQTKEPVYKFFKSIKAGVRLCYGIIQSVDEEIIQQTQESKEIVNSLNSIIKKIHQSEKGKQFCKNEKILKIVEVDAKKLVYEPNAVEKQDKRISYVLPIKSREVNISDTELFQMSIAELVEEGDIINVFNYVENKKALISGMFQHLNGFTPGSENKEFKTLFNYCIPLPVLVNLFSVFNVSILSTDKEVEKSFDNTKRVIKEIFNSIYETRGKDFWKKVDDHTASRGGPIGIATSAIPNKNS